MNIEFILPDIGEGIVECELVEWLVKEGDTIIEDQPIADVMTDKALVQIPAMHSGVIEKLHYKQGDIAKVHAPLFSMIKQGDVTPKETVKDTVVEKNSLNDSNSVSCQNDETTVNTSSIDVKSVDKDKERDNGNIIKTEDSGKLKSLASPAVRRVARELDVDLNSVVGSGKKGRVYKDDILAFTESPITSSITQSTSVEPIRGVKALMAKAMVNSVSSIPHFTYCEEIDMTDLIALRLTLKSQYSKDASKNDLKLTMMPFFMKAMSLALNEYPIINSQVNDDCSEITYYHDHNIGIAVDSKVGLLVPNIKKVQDKSILDIALELTELTLNARNGRVQSADLKGGTITISNIGAIGGTVATPIINKPEVAIVALGKVQKLPRFNQQGEVEARHIMQVSWSGDHRVIDGGTIARFCNLWKSYLEQPNTMLVALA
jgi:2-oxoisovalerate dehydrogenase E2 component (dihydrolipoyl transacylase)